MLRLRWNSNPDCKFKRFADFRCLTEPKNNIHYSLILLLRLRWESDPGFKFKRFEMVRVE